MADAFGIAMKYGGGDPFAREILQSSSSRAYELDLRKRELDTLAKSAGAAPDHIQQDRRTLDEATDRYRTIVQAIIEALEPSKERSE